MIDTHFTAVPADKSKHIVEALAPVAMNPDARYFLGRGGFDPAKLAEETRFGLSVSQLLDKGAISSLAGGKSSDSEYKPGDTIGVLNYGFVEYMEAMGDDDAIADAARTSYTGGKRTRSNEGLLRYLLRHQHTTPFEMGEFKFRVYIPIFVYRQMFRHRTASQLEPEIADCITNDTAFQSFSVQNEMSGRYVEMPNHYFLPELASIQKQSTDNKQGRNEGTFSPAEQKALRDKFQREVGTMRQWYEASLKDDVAKELSRVNLPLSQYTLLIWKIDLKNLMHFIALRAHGHAQYEVREYARALLAFVRTRFPVTASAFEDYMISGDRFSRGEIEALRTVLTEQQREKVYQHFAEQVKNSRERAEFAAKLGITVKE
ncbi:MAG: FAD-dependent thymidylate synthase [Planctomycetaceae bacterium]|nr:FAD-dependent thymidylate synthase [Planctomycetaceae bacterium]